MIKFILHGGSKENDLPDDNLIREIFCKNKYIYKVLIVPFARNNEDWDNVYEKYKRKYNKVSIKIVFDIASKDKKILKMQFRDSDIIMFSGGGEFLLKRYINKTFLLKNLKNKIVFGSSAGCNIFSKYYYSNDRKSVEKGLGILNIKTICHFNSENVIDLDILNKKKNTPIMLAIGENQFISIYHI